MSLKRNVLASIVSQVYAAVAGIALVPLYLRYMGAEAYGLVGFFAMLLMWFGLLDAGMTPTLARETARQRGGASTGIEYRRLARALEVIFLAVALIGGTAVWLAADTVATQWLQASQLPRQEVVGALQLMGPLFALRWMAGLYRGALGGAEQIVWLAGFGVVVATLRFVGVLPLLIWVGATPTLFFGYQLAVTALETAVLVHRTYANWPPVPAGERIGLRFAPLLPLLRFSLTIAFTSSVWILITQTDKLVLSRVLPLGEFGHFTLAVLTASAIQLLSGPIATALMPRLARLEAEGGGATLIAVYRDATQAAAVLAGASAVTLALAAEPLLWAWTGDRDLARSCAPILALYALGNGVLAVAAFPYYLQYAKGDLRLHLRGNIVFVALFVPGVALAALHFGALGAGWVWLGMNLLSMVAWLPLVHRKFAPGLNSRWYTQDTTVILAAAALAGAIVAGLLPEGPTRAQALGGTFAIGFAAFAGALAASSSTRAFLGDWLSRRRAARA